MLTDFAMFGSLTFETLAVLSIFVFRFRRPDAERPYRCPGYPVVPLLYVLLPAFVLTNMADRNSRSRWASAWPSSRWGGGVLSGTGPAKDENRRNRRYARKKSND